MSNLILRTQNPVDLWSDFDRIFDSVFSGHAAGSLRSIPVDVREEKDRYVMEVELPGYSENDVDIRIEDRLLVIESVKKAEKTTEENRDTARWLIRERGEAAFRRSFSLPKDADPDRIDALYRDGLLTLTLHKNEKAAPRTIQIKRG